MTLDKLKIVLKDLKEGSESFNIIHNEICKNEAQISIREEIIKRFKIKYNFPCVLTGVAGEFMLHVYNVPQTLKNEIEDYIADIDWELFNHNDFCLCSHVVNEEDTKKYYPEYQNYVQN